MYIYIVNYECTFVYHYYIFSYVTIDTEKAPRLCLVPLYLNDRVQKLYTLQWFTYFLLAVCK